MIKKFEVGKYYRWVGPQKPTSWGINDKSSNQWFRGKAHKCKSIKPEYGLNDWVSFYGITGKWAYDGFINNFEEVTSV